MGVPKFFRWVAERYPSVITPFKETGVSPQVDNLYLDMNGIIHNCTHPNDFDATKKSMTEKEMVQAMYAYLEKLFNAIKPRKFFFLAVDGCAPRAKMNQQRQRRYRSGYEMMLAREEALKMGEDLPEEEDLFDSNCITPGTEFMVRVSEHFQYFIQMKLNTDSAWRKCQVVYSGHDHPGEGEHKILDLIRGRKSSNNYSPDETHCMYGLDADLVMLALSTHEPNFILLREVVSFNSDKGKVREKRLEDEAKGIVAHKSFQKEDEFVLLHINVLRDYLHVEIMQGLVKKYIKSYGPTSAETAELVSKLDFERVIDDFVFMCFFIGNDFLPTIPTISINDGHMTTMLGTYRDNILGQGEYLTNDGGSTVNWHGVERFLTAMGKLEFDVIKSREIEAEEYQKRQARYNGDDEVQISTIPVTSIGEYKERYYREKLMFEGGWDPNSKDMKELRLHYLEGIMWVLGYYFQSPPSWKWYYPHYYAPLASDLVGLAPIAAQIKFEKGEPFLPHQQLLAVLPPMSFRSLPQAYWPLLKSESSPLRQYFPDHLKIDKEGARAPWEGIVLIPFINEDVLIAAYESVQNRVTDVDRSKNRIGKVIKFRYNENMPNPMPLKSPLFDPIALCFVEKIATSFPSFKHFKAALCPGYHTGPREGWSSLRTKMPIICPVYETGAVTIFGQPTRKESMLLELKEKNSVTTSTEVSHLIGKEIFVGFPHYIRARVTAVSDRNMSFSRITDAKGNHSIKSQEIYGDGCLSFKQDCDTHRQYLKEKIGILLPDVHVLVRVQHFTGMRLSKSHYLVRTYSNTESVYPFQVCETFQGMGDLKEDPRYIERDANDDMNGVQMDKNIIYNGPIPANVPESNLQFVGSVGLIVDTVTESNKSLPLYSLNIRCPTSPQTIPRSLVEYAATTNWVPLREVARILSLNPYVLSVLTSSLVTSSQWGSHELGLCLKFSGKNLARLGYTKMEEIGGNSWNIDDQSGTVFERLFDNKDTAIHMIQAKEGGRKGQQGGSGNTGNRGVWFFSHRALSLIKEYCRLFQPLVQYLGNSNVNTSSIDPVSFMTGQWLSKKPEEVIKEITNFLADDGVLQVPMIPAGEDSFPIEHILELEEHLIKSGPRQIKEIRVNKIRKRSLIFPTAVIAGHNVSIPVSPTQKYSIGARVTNIRTCGSVLFGAQGTITRLLASGASAEVVFDDEFISGTTLGGRIKTNRGAIVRMNTLLVLDSAKAAGDAGGSNAKPVTVSLKLAEQIRSETKATTDLIKYEKVGTSTIQSLMAIQTAALAKQGQPPASATSHLSTASSKQSSAALPLKFSGEMSPQDSSTTNGVLAQLAAKFPSLNRASGSTPNTSVTTAPFRVVRSKGIAAVGEGSLPDQISIKSKNESGVALLTSPSGYWIGEDFQLHGNSKETLTADNVGEKFSEMLNLLIAADIQKHNL
eukprot:Tbor_TRINITY_DN5039_c0_g3::TRINITY_DN5039_c0_g3_i1::g.13960::m.13960/K12618/XRN1, SEP1, KEM1; 5'-3' exoribonuclease 1